MRSKLVSSAINLFNQRYNRAPTHVVTAPGRINLIGEHTDYSEGFVLPVAIDRFVTIAFTPRQDRLVQVYSANFKEATKFSLDNLEKTPGGWEGYIKGVAWAVMNFGCQVSGWDGVLLGNIPIGAGLSSSAALEVATGKVFSISSKVNFTPTQLALIGQKAEQHWVGVNVGIMDQLIASAGTAGQACLLDCRSLEFEYVPIPDQIQLVVMDTLTRRELTHSNYNTRHEEAIQVARRLGVESLRDASGDLLQNAAQNLPPMLYRRALHVISENERVHLFVDSMRNIDLKSMGRLVNDSHASLRDNYEVTNHALDLIVKLAQRQPNCLGARMMGAVFGGCALALLTNDPLQPFSEAVITAYQTAMGFAPKIYPVKSVNGVTCFPTPPGDE